MQSIETYIQHLEELTAKLPCAQHYKEHTNDVELALNGQLSKTLRKHVPLADLQASGAFFTGEVMADQLVATIEFSDLATVTVLDPACGGGNLLLAYARRLSILPTLYDTISDWGQRLYGIDIHPEFVRATRARLFLLATLRGLAQFGSDFIQGPTTSLSTAFPNIKTGNSLEIEWPEVTLYLLNPPFNRAKVPEWCSWATSKTSQAALFISKCLSHAPLGSAIRAILPDVLRSGSNYNKWRKHVGMFGSILGVEALGQFDAKTQVDVFLLTLQVGQPAYQAANWINPPAKPTGVNTIGDHCQINVGRVVPHRDPEEGLEYSYIDVHNLPRWGSLEVGQYQRRFKGNTFTTPFVVVRRTSKASDASRAVGTVVYSPKPEQVAVENHLLVLRPHSGSTDDCERLLKILKDSRTDDWLNETICCRHLTVGSVQSIPWWPNE
jgi:SAM-dependent methyltransferase